MYICVSNNGTERYKVSQNNWNIDQLNGNGSSGLSLNFTNTQLFIIDMEWLGVGRIRFGFYAYGRIIYCHQITNINALTEPYTTSINLPVCYSIHYSGDTTTGPGPGTMTQICSTVISEGGYNPIGRPFSYTSKVAKALSGTTEIPLIALRGGSGNCYHQNIIPSDISLMCTSPNDVVLYLIRIYQAPNSPGTITWTDVDAINSVAQYSTSIGEFDPDGSILAYQNYFYGKGTVALSDLSGVFSDQILHITSNIINISDILVVSALIASGTSGNIFTTINWKEVY
jgi:hypothetical protein